MIVYTSMNGLILGMIVEDYFSSLEEELNKIIEVARKARSLGYDPTTSIEIEIANKLHERIVALFQVESLGERVKYWLDKTGNNVETAFRVIAEIIPKLGDERKIDIKGNDEYRAELALRVGMAIITDAIVSAPIEGISKVMIKGSGKDRYLSIYYNGPIRTAGGTEGAISVLMADYIRQRLGLSIYRPTHEEVERYVEEVFLYKRVAHLQYNSEPNEVRKAVLNIPVEVTGPPTEKDEVSSFRNLARVETNRLRGGAVLVINDCIIQKSKKLKKIIKQLKESSIDFNDLEWKWLGENEKGKSEEKIQNEEGEEGCTVVAPSYKYLKDAVMGRPILSYPSRIGGFRLRYGRARNTGLASIGISPATMYILDSFVAVGTQVRIERPGKSAVVMPVDWLEGPTVKLSNGSVIRVDDPREAYELSGSGQVKEIIHLGDVLIGYGEFLENNHKLLPAAWTEEWWYSLLKRKARELGVEVPVGRWQKLSFEEALEISKKFDVPLHPQHTYFWEHVTIDELAVLVNSLRNGKMESKDIYIALEEDVKRVLEKLGMPYKVLSDLIKLEGDKASLLSYIESSLPRSISGEESAYNTLNYLNRYLDVKIMPKGPTKIGMRIGRPEKARPRKMKPPVNLLYPVGELKGMTRSLDAAYRKEKVEVEVALRVCPNCGARTTSYKCPNCGARTIPMNFCPICGKPVNGRCRDHPDAEPVPYAKLKLNLKKEVDRALHRLGEGQEILSKVKGVKGLTSGSKYPEILEKGILRGKYDLYVFKDGTIRFDAVNAVLTQFKPSEIRVSVSKLRELGYTEDVKGEELVSDDQLIEIKVQDIIIPKAAAQYLLRISKYVDELLGKVYGLKPFYNLKNEGDLIGQLVLTISPHTFIANVARIIGFTDADVLYAHPFLHAAKRRNIDGDEDSIMLALDGLLDFSRKFLPSTPGGREDAPLIMVTRVDPEFIDDEVYNMEIVSEFPPEFYNATYKFEDPSKMKFVISTVESELSKGIKYPYIGYLIPTSHAYRGPLQTTYRKLNKMSQKMEAHFSLENKIRAVDKADALSRAISSHFLRDIAGNLRKFGQQTFRCTKCNAKYRRPPISGKCLVCGGPIQLTVHKGTVLKYLDPTLDLMRRYGVEGYLSQRIKILEEEINSLFKEAEEEEEKSNTLEALLESKSESKSDEMENGYNVENEEESVEERHIPKKLIDFM